jgi:hypothetical protein
VCESADIVVFVFVMQVTPLGKVAQSDNTAHQFVQCKPRHERNRTSSALTTVCREALKPKQGVLFARTSHALAWKALCFAWAALHREVLGVPLLHHEPVLFTCTTAKT